MKVMHYTGYGSPDRLLPGNIPAPEPAAGQLLVRVLATAINPIDWKLHDGQLRMIAPRKFPSVPGFDLVGEVVRGVGASCPFKPGDKILSLLSPSLPGAAAEFCLAEAAHCVLLPEEISDLEAAGLPLAGLTALQGLCEQGKMVAGQRVLIVGASGGVGHYAVQIAKALGAEVVAVCGSRNVEWVARLGADQVLDYNKTRHFGEPGSFDLIFDCVSQLAPADTDLLLKSEGIYVDTLFRPGVILRALLQPLYTRKRYRMFLVKPSASGLSQLLRLYQEHKLKTRIDSLYALEHLADAHRMSQTGRTQGKIVVTVTGTGYVTG